MVTTIQLTEETKKDLEKFKTTTRETYEEIIRKLIEIVMEDKMEFSEETKKDIKEARNDIRAGRVLTTSELVREIGLI